jgi:signal peptidase I
VTTTCAAGGAPARVTRDTARPAQSDASRGRSRQALIFLFAVFLVVTLVKAFVIGVFFIPSGSMEPLLSPGDRILVNMWESVPNAVT